VGLRLLLVRHAAPADRRQTAFGLDGPLSDRSRERAVALRRGLPRARASWVSPAQCALETAEALDYEAVVDDALRDWDSGAWAGRTVEELLEEDPAGIAAWRGDPAAAPHGGESLEALIARAGDWLEARAEEEGTRAAVTHAAVVRALLVVALGMPVASFWSLDIAPTSVTELRRRDGRWALVRANWEPALIHVPRGTGAVVAASS
jgi:broad specificity phosphatase PhoE